MFCAEECRKVIIQEITHGAEFADE